MILPKSEGNNDIEKSTELGSQYSFPIKGTSLLGEIIDCRAQIRNIKEDSGGSYCTRKEMNKKDPHSNGVMSKKKGMNFQWPKLERDEPCNK